MLELLLQRAGFLRDRAARQVEPVERDVAAAAGKLDGGAATDAGGAATDHCGAATQAREVAQRLSLCLLADFLEQSIDRFTRVGYLGGSLVFVAILGNVQSAHPKREAARVSSGPTRATPPTAPS